MNAKVVVCEVLHTLLQKFATKCNHGSKVNESQSLQPKDSVLARFSKSTIINFKVSFSIP
jgi:hypothetical protein